MEEVKGITLSTRETVIKKKYGQQFWNELITQVLTQNNMSPGTIFLSGSNYPLKVLMDIDEYIHNEYISEDKEYQLTIDNARLYANNTYSTVYKIILKFLKPELILSRAPDMWQQQHPYCEMECYRDRDKQIYTLKNPVPPHSEVYAHSLLGYFFEIGQLIGLNLKKGEHNHLSYENGKTTIVSNKLTPSCLSDDSESSYYYYL